MAYGGVGDYEWEEVEAEDWEVICVDDEEQKIGGAPRTGIEFTLEDEAPWGPARHLAPNPLGNHTGPQRRPKRTITKRERDAAAAVHRSHVLCLLARALLLDWGAEQPEVQATALSLLPAGSALRNQSAEEPQRAINGMLPLVTWFRGTFAVLPPDVVWRQGTAGGGRLRPEDQLDEQLLRTGRSQAGTVECLVALFVALVRAQGGSARVVRLLDAVPLAPWRARPVTVRTTGGPPPPPPPQPPQPGGGPRRVVDLEAGDELPLPPPAAAGAGAGAGAKGRGKGKQGRKLEEVLAEKGYGGGKGGKGSSKKRKAEGAALAGSPGAGGSGGGTEGGAAGSGGGKRQRQGDDGDSGGAASTGTGAVSGRPPTANRGEEEFELQLQMALMATSREAEARQAGKGGTAGVGAGSSNVANGVALGGTSGSGGGTGARGQTRGGGGGKAAGGGGGGAAGAPAGIAMSVRAQVVVNCWAEVYCGSADRGRWVAVDVVNGYVDRPELVDTATLRPTPVCYVVAAEHGALLDVTARYCHNLLAAQRNRDETWWAATAGVVQRPGCLGRAAPAAAWAADPRVSSTAGGGADGGKAAARSAPAAAAVDDSSGNGRKRGSGGGPRIIDARLSHQRGEIDNPMGPHAAAAAAAADADAAAAARDAAAPAAGRSAAAGPGSSGARDGGASLGGGGGGAAAGGSADLRAAREAAELQHRGMSQLQGLPTSIEGFKSHPLYILKRHIGKYEALRPGTSPLGLHRGEPYYPRANVSVLHTVERWRREGRQVRDCELGSPVKVVKKRTVPGPPGAGPARRAASLPSGGAAGKPKGRGGGGGEDGARDDDDDDVLLLEAAGDAGAAAGGADGGPTINLYGKWQTDEWEPPAAEGGVVPRNERGNVECPPLVPKLPRGTVHITLGPGLGGVCRTLGVDYAPGLVGFEVQGGRMVPKIEGVVVCEEVSELVVAAYLERESARAAAAAARLRRAATVAWLQLLGAVRVRLKLERDYAGGGGGGGHEGQAAAGPAEGGAATAAGGAAAAAALAASAAEVAAARGGVVKPRSAVAAAAAAAAAAAGPRDRALDSATLEAEQQRHLAADGAAAADAAATETGADVEMEEF